MIFAFTFDNSLSGWKFMSVGMHKGMHYLSPPCADVSSLSCTLERSGKKLYRIIDVFPLSGSEKLYYGNKKKNISIYVKTITQTFHFDWRFNENSFLWSFFSSFFSWNNFIRSFVTWNEILNATWSVKRSVAEIKLFHSTIEYAKHVFWRNSLGICVRPGLDDDDEQWWFLCPKSHRAGDLWKVVPSHKRCT